VFVFAAIGFLMFSLVNRPHRFGLIAVSCCIIGFFGFAALPVALELSVETTFPVSEGISAGLMWMTGQIFGVIFLALVSPMRGEPRFYNGTTRVYNITTNATNPLPPGVLEFYDYTNACYMLLGAVGMAALPLLFFKTEYKRLASEQAYRESHPHGGDGKPAVAEPATSVDGPSHCESPVP